MSQITDKIKESIDIVDLVREYVPSLKKAGISWKAQCPFHQEKTASFVVSPQKQIWHCFGCSRGGDVFGFVKETEGLEFPDALRLLAKRAGVLLERQDPKAESERSRLLDIIRISAAWYHQALLKAKSGDIARDYLTKRNVKPETQESWQLGFAPDSWEGLTIYLQSRGYRDEEIIKAGLASANERGGVYDRFRNRLMFPITDVHGSVVGFTARKLKEDDVGGKYINTPETSIYHKSSVLYGLSKAKQDIRKHDLAVVVEGNMDCISSHEAGILHVVASSGTALTREQIQLLKRYTKNIVLAFDPDIAGQDALMRGLEVAWREDMSISVIKLPKDTDPDDLIKKDSKLWESTIQNKVQLMDWVFVAVSKKNDVTTAIGKKHASQILLSWISRIPDPIEQTHYIQQLARLVNVDEKLLRGLLLKKQSQKTYNNNSQSTTNTQEKKHSILEKTAIRLLAILITRKNVQEEIDINWPTSDFETLYKLRIELYDGRTSTIPEQLQSRVREILLVADEFTNTDGEEREIEQVNLIKRLNEHKQKQQLIQLREDIKQAEASGNTAELEQYLAKWQELFKNLNH